MRCLLARDRSELCVIVAQMHVDPRFGETYREFENDGFVVAHRLEAAQPGTSPPGTSPVGSLAQLGGLLGKLAKVLETESPDLLLLAGDRREQLIAALAAASLGIAVAHIQGGEL